MPYPVWNHESEARVPKSLTCSSKLTTALETRRFSASELESVSILELHALLTPFEHTTSVKDGMTVVRLAKVHFIPLSTYLDIEYNYRKLKGASLCLDAVRGAQTTTRPRVSDTKIDTKLFFSPFERTIESLPALEPLLARVFPRCSDLSLQYRVRSQEAYCHGDFKDLPKSKS